MNSKCQVQSKRRCESHESCVCFAGFSACGCQKKSVVYETEYRHVIDVGSAGGRGRGEGRRRRCGSGFQRQKIMSSVAGDRGGTGSKQHCLFCVV